MSDVSKTNELIENARARAREIRERFPAKAETLGDANWIDMLVVSLATRVPVQGEPNDDDLITVRNRILALGGNYDISTLRHVLAGFSRTTVPDAATELAKIKPLFENLSREYPVECNKRVKAEAERDAATAEVTQLKVELESRIDDRDYWYKYAVKMQGQLEDALAAVERVRTIPVNVESDSADMAQGWADAMSAVFAALDGAPEPEWEYGMQDDYGLSFVRNIAEAYDHANRQDPELNPRPVRRRKAGLWLPVEGESA